jgi:murein DD-endopeptidase MepM/ murein hydrolase activator NlpD
MSRVRGRRALLLLALFASFCAGVIVDGWLRTSRPPKPLAAAAEPSQTRAGPIIGPAPPPRNELTISADPRTMGAAPAATIDDRSTTRLRVPIDGISIESFKGGFSELRGDHLHEGVDIIVPRGTPIHAVQDGTIAKLFFSQFGGVTIYQFEDDGRLCFYYAHLQRYADGLHDGQHVSQGEVIGYVGTSGNAPPGTPHLHFAISELNADRKWWQGRPLDPYLVFKDKGED